ncbi:MAG: hypothetical protein AB1599_05255 [Planctomycetota bacterium]
MSRPKKIVLISVLSVVALLIAFVCYHYVLYLKATNRMEELSADLEERISEWEKKEYKRQPLFGPAIPGNAAEYYNKAGQESKSFEFTIKTGMQMDYAAEHPDAPISPELKAHLAHIKGIFDECMTGANAQTYKSLLNLRGDGWEENTSGLGAIRKTVKLAAIQTRLLIKDGKVSEAFKLSCSMNRLGDDMCRRGTLINALVGIALSAVSQTELLWCLNSNEFSEPQLSELRLYLQALFDSEPSFQGIFETESLYIEAILRQTSGKCGLMPKENEFGFGPAYVNRTDIVDAWQEYIPHIKELVRIISLPYAQMDAESGRFNKQIDIESMDTLSQVIIPSTGNMHKSYYMIKAQRRGLYILTALKLYKARHQKYPDKLSDLAPDIINDIPLDPFTDQPFIYKVNQDGTILLYSVGTNLKDDNGDDKKDNDIVITPYRRWQERK